MAVFCARLLDVGSHMTYSVVPSQAQIALAQMGTMPCIFWEKFKTNRKICCTTRLPMYVCNSHTLRERQLMVSHSS